MSRVKVLHPMHIPIRFPIWTTATAWLLLDRFQPPGWIWGVALTVGVLVWIVCTIQFFREDYTKPKEMQ